jgi:D-3-phosphoglycerate dehydrogenase
MHAHEKILIIDPVHENLVKNLEKDFEVIYHLYPKRKDLLNLIKEIDILILRSGTIIDSEILKNAKKLKIISRAGTGMDNIDVKTAEDMGISVFNTPGINSNAAAELTIGFLFCLSRHIVFGNNSLKLGFWKKKECMGNLIENKTLGIVGYGSVGKNLAQKAIQNKLKVYASVKNLTEERIKNAKKEGVILTKLEEFISKVDFLCLCLPLTNETEHMVNLNFIKKMKKTSYLINMSRGKIINENDFYRALKNQIIKGAAVDVFDKTKSPIFELNNVIVTPHIGAMAEEVQKEIADIVYKKIIKLVNN